MSRYSVDIKRHHSGDSCSCKKCGLEMLITEQMCKHGKYICNSCQSKASVEWAKRNRDKKRSSNNKYQHEHSAMRAARTALYRLAHPDRNNAHQVVQSNIRN